MEGGAMNQGIPLVDIPVPYLVMKLSKFAIGAHNLTLNPKSQPISRVISQPKFHVSSDLGLYFRRKGKDVNKIPAFL
jgi:hypothetical protein